MHEKGLFVYSGQQGIVNSTVIKLAADRLIVVDTMATPEDAADLARQAGQTGEVVYVINTHEHADHLAGNNLFTCPVIASSSAREQMQRVHGVRLPDITFEQQLNLYLGEEVIIRRFGGHSPGASIVYLPERKVLLTGDLIFNGRPPFMGQAVFSTWIDALAELETWDIDLVIPGHGPTGGKEIMSGQRRLLLQFTTDVLQLHAEGRAEGDIFEEARRWMELPERWQDMLKRAISLAIEQLAGGQS